MSARDAKAQGVALAGVAIVGLLLGGMLYAKTLLDSPSGSVIVKPALVGQAPRWTDGYSHFILTMAGPVPGSAHRIVTDVVIKTDVVAKAARHADGARSVSSQGGARPREESGEPVFAARTATSTAPRVTSNEGVPWQAAPPDSADPIVLPAGEPVSLLPKLFVGYPKGTRLERDSEGNIRAVLPPGFRFKAPSGTVPSPGGNGISQGNLPVGWQPDAREVVASLLDVAGVHSASPVWGDRYQIATSLSAARVRSLPNVTAVAPNNLLAFSSSGTLPATNDPNVADDYYLANNGQTVEGQVGTAGASGNFAYAWARSRGATVVVADIDTGVDLANPDLASQIVPESMDFAVSPASSDVQAAGTADGFYHATTVDGVLAGEAGNGWGGAGAAPEAKILALKCGDTTDLADSCIYAAGEYAITEKEQKTAPLNVDVVNMSFGEQASSDPTLASLMGDLETARILVTASAGNWGTDNDSTPVLPADYAEGDPGASVAQFPNVISVGATDNQDNLASYSDYGGATVDLMAPGTNLLSDYPTYTGFSNAYVSGTSYAAPMVAAAAALLWSVDPSLTYAEVKADIISSVQSVNGLSGKCVTGGRLDAQAALAAPDVVEPVQFRFAGFDQVTPEQATSVSVSATAQSGALPVNTSLGYRLELVYNYNGTMYYVANQTVDWTMGLSGQQTTETGGNGSVFIEPAGITSVNYGASPLNLTVPAPGLAPGTYALVAYAATGTAPGTAIGAPQAVFFNVGTASPTPEVTTTVASGGPTTTTGSGTSTTAQGATTTASSPVTTTGGATSASTTTSAGNGKLPTTTVLSSTTSTSAGGATTTTPSATTDTTGSTPTTAQSGATTTTASATATSLGSSPFPTIDQGTTTTTTAPPPTTTVPVTTTTAASTTTTATATPTTTAAASFSIDSVDPNELAASGGDVSIFGSNLPADPVVTVGAELEAVSTATSTEIDVMVGAMPAGNYTVTVYNADKSQSASLLDGLTVGTPGTTTTTAAGAKTTTTEGGAATTTTAGGAKTTTTEGGAATTTTPAGAKTTTTEGGAATTTTGAATSTTGAGTTTTRAATTTTGAGGTIAGPDGMVLAPVAAGDPISDIVVGEWPALTASQIISDNGAAAGSAVDGVDVTSPSAS
jgi:subtilisin family serine protease